jgi:hypothetical protein
MQFSSKFLRRADKLSQRHSGDFRGIPIVVEWPQGSTRVGKDKNGKGWKRKMLCDYGYIDDGSTAVGDHEPLDVYIGPDAASDKVYVVEQLTDDGEFDEYKCLLGFPDLESAYETYLKHYPDGWDDTNVGDIFEVPFDYVFDKVEEHLEEQEDPQGKTAGVDSLPRYLYHGSPKVHMQDNLLNGLRRSNSVSHTEWDGGAVYLALDAGAAAMYPDHWETGESEHGKVVYRVETKYLNKSKLRPDDQDFIDVFANLTDAEAADLEERFGDAFDSSSWVRCEWPVSLYLSGQVAYIGDIPPEALSVIDIKKSSTVPEPPTFSQVINANNNGKFAGVAYLKALLSMK